MALATMMGELRMYKRIAMVAACAVAALAVSTNTANGQVYPNKAIKIIVPFGPGGSTDITARVFGKFLEELWKQPVVVENRAGANGIIGTDALKNSAPDGYTLALSSNSTHAAAPYLFKKLPYDPIKDFEHIGLFGIFGSVALVPTSSPFKSIPELASYARANPGKVFFGYFNTSSQIPGELLKARADLPIEGVPYKTITNAVPDLISGQIQFMFMDYVAASSHISSGKLVPIAITEAKRLERWPTVPAVAEFYPGYEVQAFL
jgi:tripartite-type tricarboxylate transporter receptor subunit TctC